MDCYLCRVKEQPQIDPFINPIEDGRIKESDIDPLLYNNDSLLDIQSSVSDRISGFGEVEETIKSEHKPKAKRTRRSKTKTKAKSKSAIKNTKPIEKAEGLTEEIDFDDADMIEKE